jgi:hypothetical protein
LKTHPTDLHLEALYLDLGPEHRKVLDHLARCARCRERAAEIRRPKTGASETPDMPESGDEPPDPHVFPFALVLLQERTEAANLLVDLLRQPASRREAFLRIDPRFRTWGFVELLVARSLETATRDAEHAEELGGLALTVSSLLDPGFYGAETIEDLRARAWGYIANARRVRSDLDGAIDGLRRLKVQDRGGIRQRQGAPSTRHPGPTRDRAPPRPRRLSVASPAAARRGGPPLQQGGLDLSRPWRSAPLGPFATQPLDGPVLHR